ncbi:MAG: hypothetical protein II452_06560 [Paludibacteraceae bacterium]|nr:hypothetical protein [Paludibacteraceae bacterium]
MKKFFSLMAVALMSIAMMAGENDLLWDYTDAAPSANPDNGLTYGSKFSDGPGTKNGLRGIKLNDGGYCYFTKAAVAGKLKLGFGPRSGSNAANIDVYTWTGESTTAPARAEMTLIGTTKALTEYGTDEIELTAEQNHIYLCRHNGVETGLQVIQFREAVARTFVDFQIEFRDDPYSVLLPANGELPEGVTVTGVNYNGSQHGIYGGTITVPVDGTVKFTIGGCQHSQTDITVKKDGEYYATISNKIIQCGEQKPNYNQNVPYIYMGGAGVLTFEIGSQTYIPYFFAEAAEVTPCEVIFKDQNGAELGRVETIEGATLEAIPYAVEDLPVIADGYAFRGWFYTNGKKAQVGDPITGNTTIQAKITPIETVTVGSVQTYDFASATFYPEDHETVEVYDGSYYNNHGWYFNANGSIRVQVAGNAVVVVTLCKYSESGDVNVVAGEQVLATYPVVKNETPDGTELTAQYEGDAGWLTINWTAKQYIHKVVVYNVLDFLEKDVNTGYFIVPAGDVASFLMAIVQAQPGDKIFLPNGIYDLGETCLTTISKNNISIIGQSMEGTIIKNAPDAAKESIDQTATIKINDGVSGTYLQDLTIQNALDYYKNDNGRAVALWDRGTKTVCKNVRLLSYQDTYYSNKSGAVKYFEDCEIHGTVDFICGDGSVYFKNNLLYCEKRKASGGGSDALTANNGPATDKGYVFEGCTVKSECPVVSFGRAWNNTPSVSFLNTLVDYSAGEFSFENGDIQRWTKKLMNANAWPQFGEYNTHLADGTVLTPASNVVTFLDEKSGNATQDIETVLSAENAAARTMEWTLGDWSATAQADATQAVCELTAEELEPNGIYLVEGDGEFAGIILGSEFMDRFALYDGVNYTVRKANARGGFGLKAGEEPHEGITNTEVSNDQVKKIVRNGQVVVVRDNKEYNVLGAQL